ncbi:MAG TPA: DUF2784 domain-containing protein [Burkholderiaceae bacterium]|nr:DUF2784 domain-containing protein [Burkholderiaceae bacterium]
MTYRLAADAVVLVHLAFIVFAFAGGLLVLRDRRWAWLHLPAVAWACWVEFSGRICPLTPLELALRQRAGDAGYSGGFIDHYLIPLIYPPGLTPAMQTLIGLAVLLVNAGLYLRAWRPCPPAEHRGVERNPKRPPP